MKSRQESKVYIHALIGDEKRALVDNEGLLPSMEFVHGTGTYEDTLMTLGRDVLNTQFLGVEYRAYDLERQLTPEKEKHSHIIYKTDATPGMVSPDFETRMDTPMIIPETLKQKILDEWRTRKLARQTRKSDSRMLSGIEVII